MKIELTELTELTWLDERMECSLLELAERSRLTEPELQELIACGVIAPRNPSAAQQSFAGHALAAARIAARLRDDFELDLRGVALALTLLRRVRELEIELGQLRVRGARG